MPSRRRQKDRQFKGKPRGFRRDRDCLTCKTTGAKCDLNRPSCGQCQAAGIECNGYENRVRWAPISFLPGPAAESDSVSPGEPEDTPPSALTLTPTPTLDAESPLSPSSARAQPLTVTSPPRPGQHYYSFPVVNAQEESDDANWTTHYDKYLDFFTSKFEEAKLIHRSQSEYSLEDVWQFIWSRISGQLLHGGNVELDPLFLQTTALASLRRAIQNGDILAMFGIVTFSFLDVYEGPFADWEKHCVGARALLDIHCSNQAELESLYRKVPGLLQAMSLLMWYDVMGTFLRGKGTPVFEDWHRAHLDEEFWRLVWCPRDTFDLYIRVIHARDSKTPIPLAFFSMEQLLQIITEEQSGSSAPVRNSWRYGAILSAIYTNNAESVPAYDAVTTMLADKILHIMKTIPPRSGGYRHLAAAVTVLGEHGPHLVHREAANAYFVTCRSLDIPIYNTSQTYGT